MAAALQEPFRTGSASSASPCAAMRRSPITATDDAGRERKSVLIIEPDERTRSVLEVGLAREGFDVIAAQTAEGALCFLGPDRPLPGMIISEADLRGSDGFSFCSTIRADQRAADLPVVLLSRTAEGWHRELAGGSGADQYLPKPVFLNDVIALARLMSGRSSWDARFPASTDELPIFQSLRAILSGVRSGRLELEDDSGWLGFRDGCVIDAMFENARGGEALRRLLLLGKGGYTVSFGPALARTNMAFGLEDLCGRTYQQVQRWTRLLQDAVPLESVLVVEFSRLVEELDRLPDQVNEIIRLSDGRRRVRDVIVECTLDEVTALEVVTRLHVMGLLVPPPTSTILLPPAVPPVIEELDPVLRRQLDAFQIQPVVEAPEPRLASAAETPELSAFAHEGTLATDADVEVRFFTEPESAPDPVRRREQSETENAQSVVDGPSQAGWWLLGMAVLVSASAVGGSVWWTRTARVQVAPVPVTVVHELPAVPSAAVPELAQAPDAPEVLPAVALIQPLVAPAVVGSRPERVSVAARPNPAEGIALYDAGKLREAAALLDVVTQRDPRSTQAWVYLGLARFDLGDTDGAEQAAMKALALDMKDGRARMLLASVYLTAGQAQKAEAELRRYLELEPNGPYATEARQLLRQ